MAVGSTPSRLARRRSSLSDVKEIAGELWAYRELLYQLTLRNIRIRYKQAVMGFGWAIFMPMVIVLAGIIVKFAAAQLAGRPFDTAGIGGMAVKALPWAFFVGAIGLANQSLVGNRALVTKIYFPREVFPLSATLSQAFDSSIAAVAMGMALPFLGLHFGAALLWIAPLAVLLFLVTVAMGLFLSCANLFFRDVKYIVQVLLTFGIFFTPVFYEPIDFGPTGARLMMINPLAPILEGFRLSINHGHLLLQPIHSVTTAGASVLVWSPWYLLYSALWAVGGLYIASVLFHRLEYVFAEYV